MPFRHLKITDSVELLQKHFLCCDERPLTYLVRIAEENAVRNAVNNGWLEDNTVNGTVVYRLTPKGKAFLESISR